MWRNFIEKKWNHARAMCVAGFMRAQKDVKTMPVLFFGVCVVSFVFGAWLGLRAGALWFLFLVLAVFEWDDRIAGVLALGSLVTCPILLSFNQQGLAELMAEYAYFFMVITVVLQLIELKRHPERFEDDQNV